MQNAESQSPNFQLPYLIEAHEGSAAECREN